MKAIMIIYNQALTDVILDILDRLSMRGYTQWENVVGRGSIKGEPHLGNHTWPAKNGALLVVTDDNMVEPLLSKLRALDKETEEQGTRAFVWNVENAL